MLGMSWIAQAQTSNSQQGGPSDKAPDLREYRTVYNAVTTPVGSAGQDGGKTGYLGIAVVGDSGGRVVVDGVQPDSPAEKAGVKTGDVIARLDERPVGSAVAFREWLQVHSAGSALKLQVRRQEEVLEMTAMLTAATRPLSAKDAQGGKGGGKGKGGPGALTLWQKPVFRVGVVFIEFSDVKHDDKINAKEWDEALFSFGSYTGTKNPTGQTVHGSLNDYFAEQSGGKFKFEGKLFDWVDVGKKRGDYVQGTGTSNKTQVLTEALAKVAARDGKDALKSFDGLLFIYAGAIQKTNRGAVYYPHAGSVTDKNDQRFRYFLAPEGGSTMTTTAGLAKIAGEMLGLPDLAARTENVGSRSLGVWCILSNPIPDGRPQHFSAWAKEKMGWTKPAIIDPTVKQKLILGPIEDSPRECFKVLVRPNGSEYYLLENRCRKGFDFDLPAGGLLIWRVVNDRPVLCESHGLDSPKAPRRSRDRSPSRANSTMPSHRTRRHRAARRWVAVCRFTSGRFKTCRMAGLRL